MSRDAVNSGTKAIWEEFGRWLREQRVAAGLTQKQVAARTRMHTVHIARLEAGESGTKRDSVIALANAIGIDVHDALNRAGYSLGDALSSRQIELSGGVRILGLDEEFDEDDLREIRAIMELKIAKNRNRKTHETEINTQNNASHISPTKELNTNPK